jgi:hypothetical protein
MHFGITVEFMKSRLTLLICLALATAPGFAQTAQNRVQGTVTAADAAAKTLTLKTDKGDAVTITVTDKSHLLHLPPGETDQKKAEAIAFDKIASGDRLVASIKASADGKTNDVGTMLVYTAADLSSIHDKELQDWKTRGTTGNLISSDAAAKSFTIKVGSKEWKIVTSAKTTYQRYSPDSAKISDAKPSAYADLKAGDEVHVLGNKNSDATEIEAEQIVAGSFPQIAATIKSINAATHELLVTDLATKKPVTIRISADSTLKKLPDMAAQGLARQYGAARGGAGDGAGGRRGGGGGGFGGANGAGAAGGGMPSGGRGRGGRGDIGTVLEQAPPITIADLKPGDAIMVKTTLGSSGGAGTAVVLIAGVEPILTAAPNSMPDLMSNWNLGGGGGGGEGN